MTNTLHRFGAPESHRDDFVVFAMAAKGVNDADAVPRFQQFLRLALPHRPINMAHAQNRGIYRAAEQLTPLVHWTRGDERLDPERIIREVESCSTVAVVFDTREATIAFLADLRGADLGLSINVSALVEEGHACGKAAGLTRHSVEYSLGIHGDQSRLPDRHTLELSTMCGHGMVSHNFARKMIDLVRENRRTPQQAAASMARFCACGVFNPTRARRILEQARKGE